MTNSIKATSASMQSKNQDGSKPYFQNGISSYFVAKLIDIIFCDSDYQFDIILIGDTGLSFEIVDKYNSKIYVEIEPDAIDEICKQIDANLIRGKKIFFPVINYLEDICTSRIDYWRKMNVFAPECYYCLHEYLLNYEVLNGIKEAK